MTTYIAQHAMQQEPVSWQVWTTRIGTHATAMLATRAGAATAAPHTCNYCIGSPGAIPRGGRESCQTCAFPFLVRTPLATTTVYTFKTSTVEMVRSQRAGVFRCFQARQRKHSHTAVVLDTGQTWERHGLPPTCHIHNVHVSERGRSHTCPMRTTPSCQSASAPTTTPKHKHTTTTTNTTAIKATMTTTTATALTTATATTIATAPAVAATTANKVRWGVR